MTLATWLFIAFFIWSFPLGWFRSRWRKMVYQTDSWWINIKPYFGRELKILFGFLVLADPKQMSTVRWYRLYVVVYLLLFFGFLWARRGGY